MSFSRVLMAIVGAAALCSGCTGGDGRVTFCDSRDGIPFFSRAFTLDMAHRRYTSFDVGSYVTIVRTPRYQGMIEPFPMVVPSKAVAQAGLPVAWTLGGYRFVARGTDDPDRITVRAAPLEGHVAELGKAVHTLDYSYRAGVVSNRTDGELAGEKYVSTTYPCLGEKLDLLAIKPGSGRTAP